LGILEKHAHAEQKEPVMAEVEQKEQEQKQERTPAPRDWFGRWFEDWPRPGWWPELWQQGPLDVHGMRIEEFREGDTLVVRAEMPGMDPEKDIQIDVSDQTLRIRAERREESKTEEKGGYRSEFRYGSFSRQVPLPAGASEDDVKATYKDGILEVRVPVDQAKAEARTIPIQRS
jgi:HSP20 family protein